MPRNEKHARHANRAPQQRPVRYAMKRLASLRAALSMLARTLMVTITLGSTTVFAQTAAPGGEVVVITSYDTPPYRDALTGLRQVLQGANRTLRTILMNEDGSLEGSIVPRTAVPLTITLGSRATDAAAAGLSPNALLPCMMVNSAGRPGVLLEHSPDARVALLRQVVPASRVIGTLYSGERPTAEIGALRDAARRAGMKFVAARIDTASPLERQLDALANEFDVLLATFDLGVFSPRNAQALLLFSYRDRIPLLGLSDAWTRAGALLSTDWDYADIGRQCGEAALQMMQSGAPLAQNITPRRMVYSVNRSAARYFRLALSERLAREARQVFE